MRDDIEDLARSAQERRAILFMMAGVSMFVGLPSWQELIDHMTSELGPEGDAEHNRPPSYVSLPRAGPAQEAVLNRWGINVLTSEIAGPEGALTVSLERLSERVEEPRSQGGG